ncbi:glycoside hydrolase family 2 TIM barrel-domain containing protein [Actinomadura fibrosa]|uniref:Beta-galactosidase n=1 Tax=Actinomadura fibrosa TaxID=111802 RepID=A0ABW2XJD5_9ACTN|nr:glycoside hydrolase family 2 TIM barrel-domain containing protein [Actinomadura fibrosa]
MTDLLLPPPDRTGLIAVGRLPMRAITRAAEIDLDGDWDFQLADGWDAKLGSDWRRVQVPSLWTMSSEVDRPHYTNVAMPFRETPPDVPEHNPVGVYRRSVDLAPQPDRRIILHVGAAEGHLRAAVNGMVAGTSTDSHLAAEFDITGLVRAGGNVVELAVAKWSAAAYIEDQDHWWQSGLSRSIWIYSLPEIALADVVAHADFDPATRQGTLTVTASTTGLDQLDEHRHTVRVTVLDEEHEAPVSARADHPVMPENGGDRSRRPEPQMPEDFWDSVGLTAAGAQIPARFADLAQRLADAVLPGPAAGTTTISLDGLDVPPWSAERPHLTRIRVQLLDGDGTVVDETEPRVGFRRVEVTGRDLLVNGERVLIQGVNRHDFDPRTGRVMSRQRMRDEVSLLKRFNFNAIRTSHYPNDPYLLDLCDEMGLYVVDEADVEGHGFSSTLADDPRFREQIVGRVARMVQRDRNHPSVIAWSLGNETGYGASHDAAAAWVRRADPTRPLHYEGAIMFDWHGGHAATDIVCPMYPSFPALEAFVRDERADRPLIACEYAYSQGNSTGGLAEYWKLFESRPGLQGGFIWEFMDHTLDPNGDGRYRYGGDFGDEPNDGATVANGLVFPDLTPKPAMYEARGIFSPVRIVSDATAASIGRIRLRNRRHFADLSDLRLKARVETRDGATDAVPLALADLGPQSERTIELPADIVDRLRRTDALALSLAVTTAEDSPWAPAGTELAVHQVVLPRPSRVLPAVWGRVRVDDHGDLRHPLLAAPPRLALWRALTDNDGSFMLDQRFVRSGFFHLEVKDVRVRQRDSATAVTLHYRTAFDEPVEHRRTITGTGAGRYMFTEHVTLPEGTNDGLRVGMRLDLAEGFDHAQWVGLGPWENYPDRDSSALLGRWSAAIDDLAVPYTLPQENGTRGGVDTLELGGPAGTARFDSREPLFANVSRYTVDQLEAADHWWRLPASTATIVHLDIAHRGAGTAKLGPDTRPAHRLTGRTYSWTWHMALDRRSHIGRRADP